MNPITLKNATEYDAHAEDWAAAMDGNLGHIYLEKPAMEGELPEDLEGKTVLCIGVGSGEEIKKILEKNPGKVVAIDISEKLLEIARSRFPSVQFVSMDMTHLDFPDISFDFIYSGLAFHYASDWDRLLAGVARVLKPGGTLLFSTHHPDYWFRKQPTGNSFTNERRITLQEHAGVLPGGVEVIYYNHPSTDSILEAVGHAGFDIEKAYAPEVIPVGITEIPEADRDAYANLKKKNEEAPLFFIVRAVRK